MQKFFRIPVEAFTDPIIISIFEDFPCKVEQGGIVSFDVSDLSDGSVELYHRQLKNVPHDFGILQAFYQMTYHRNNGDFKDARFVRKSELREIIDSMAFSDEEKLRQIKELSKEIMDSQRLDERNKK